jgi:hypothetical protein
VIVYIPLIWLVGWFFLLPWLELFPPPLRKTVKKGTKKDQYLKSAIVTSLEWKVTKTTSFLFSALSSNLDENPEHMFL